MDERNFITTDGKTHRTDAPARLKGSQDIWGVWERIVPELIPSKDAAAQRMLDIHLRRYRIAGHSISQQKVLDIACGTGYGSQMLKQSGAASVLGVDISSTAIEFARSRYTDDGIEFCQGDAEQFRSDQRFDVAVSFETMEHVPNPSNFLRVIHKHLVPGGRLLLSAPVGETRHFDIYHLHAFERSDIYRLLATAGFEVEAFRFDRWQINFAEIFRRPQSEARTPLRDLLLTRRGRRVLWEVLTTQCLRLPMLMVSAISRPFTCQVADESQLAHLEDVAVPALAY